MEITRRGCTRIVILTDNHAIKIPNFFSWKMFLHGLLANMQEREWGGKNRMTDRVAPVVFGIPAGVLIVMKKARPLTYHEWFELDYEAFRENDGFVIPVENKKDSFGMLNGSIVAIDYGT